MIYLKKILIVLLLLLSLTACKNELDIDKDSEAYIYGEYFSDDNPIVKINFDTGESIYLELFYNYAPQSVLDFLYVIENGLYDNTLLDKVIPSNLIQFGNDIEVDFGVYGEFLYNNYNNPISFQRGIIGLVRDTDLYSANTQAFICMSNYDTLDGYFAAFGGIIKGFDVLDSFNSVDTDISHQPIDDIYIESIEILSYGITDMDDFVQIDLDYQSPDLYLDDSNPRVEITVSGYEETIIVELFPDVAPVTVSNFLMLVNQEFYDGLIFHRIIDDFMIQGGDPLGTGAGGSSQSIFGEFKNNGFNNNLSHYDGVISMARNGYDYDSASSQFFIMDSDYNSLDGDYAAFGYVVSGLDIVHFISSVETDSNDKPLTDVIIESIRVID